MTGIGAPLAKYFPEATPILSKGDLQNRVFGFSIEMDKTKKLFEGKLSSLNNHKDKCLGYLLILQDVTEQTILYQKVERLASTDFLTNLNNRRRLFDLGKKEITRACRYKHPISLLIIDIDLFKEINDSYGHMVGDQILKHISLSLQSTLRSVDIIGRYGGDEFIVILPETTSQTALATATRLCETIRNSPSFNTKKGEVHYTLSIGISNENDVKEDTSIYTLLERADRALYRAKALGRDQVFSENNHHSAIVPTFP